MKRMLVTLAAVIIATLQIAGAQTVEKTYDIVDFHGVSISDGFDVVLEHTDGFKVAVEVTEDFLPYVKVENRGGVLELSIDRLPFNLKQKNRTKVAKATIGLPTLTYVSMSGATNLTSNDQFANTMERFVMKVAGGSKVSNIVIKSPFADIDLSGASKVTASFRSSDIFIRLSGASRLDLTGEASEMEVEALGASKLLADEFPVDEIEARASGASTVEVRPVKALRVDLSGASRCIYYGGDDDLKVNAERVSGGSKVKHHR